MSGTARDPALPARTVPLDPGEIIGEAPDSRWRVVRHVADGGFSSVYEVRPASPETLDRHGAAPRALKCVWGTPAELTAMNDEAAKTQLVDGHPNVLTLVTSFRFERSTAPHHHVGLVLELADEDLPTFAARVRLDERAWAAVFEQVAAGLEHIHARRVVHGDIKPTNVLRIGARFAVADFGVSAPLESTRSAGIGLARTIAFWPPESATQGVLQADGVRRPPVEGWRASQLGDVWALAVSAHRMLTGRHITAGTTPEQQYELVCLGRYAVDRRLGPGWQRLLEDCLVQDPRQRRVATPAQFRQRAAELAVPPAYAGVPWPAGSPRLAALVDLDPAAGGPLLALSVDRPGGRVSGELVPAAGVLPAALHHLTEDVLPALAARPVTAAAPDGIAAANAAVAPGPGLTARLPNGAPAFFPDGAAAPAPNGATPHGAAPANAGPNGAAPHGAALNGAAPHGATPNGATAAYGAVRNGAADPAATQVVTLAELERTRQQTAAISAQRDRLAAQRDEVAADRDRLRREHAELARRLDRLEREAGLRRPPVAERERTAILAPARREPTLMMAPVRREPTKTYEPRPATPQPRPSTSDKPWTPAAPSTSDPKPSAIATAGGRLARRLGRMLRRLIMLVVVLGILSVLALVGVSALFNTTPDKVMNRVVVILDQVHGAGS
jgi:protein kinase-like protein